MIHPLFIHPECAEVHAADHSFSHACMNLGDYIATRTQGQVMARLSQGSMQPRVAALGGMGLAAAEILLAATIDPAWGRAFLTSIEEENAGNLRHNAEALLECFPLDPLARLQAEGENS